MSCFFVCLFLGFFVTRCITGVSKSTILKKNGLIFFFSRLDTCLGSQKLLNTKVKIGEKIL